MSATPVDWNKVRQELRAKRSELFDRFLKDPGRISLAIEIKMLDDEILDCAEHLKHEQDIEE
jgi:hypothetical protein